MIYNFDCHKLIAFRGRIIRKLKHFHIEKPEFFLLLCNNIVLL